MSKPSRSRGRLTSSTAGRLLLGVLVALAFSACSPANADDNGGTPPDGPPPGKPTAAAVLALEDDIAFSYMPGATVNDLEWDVEIEYNTTDVAAVFAHYDGVLRGAGFDVVEIETEVDDEIEAEFRNSATGVWVEIEVERESGRVDVDLDVEDPRTYTADALPPAFSLTQFLDLTIPVYDGASIRDIEWDFSFDHPGSSAQEAFEHYDDFLQGAGWELVELDDDDDGEWEAEYRLEGVFLELEVEADDDGETEVEIELNKLRFYQAQ